MCIAHEVVVDKKKKKNHKERLQGPSPDEISLVRAAE